MKKGWSFIQAFTVYIEIFFTIRSFEILKHKVDNSFAEKNVSISGTESQKLRNITKYCKLYSNICTLTYDIRMLTKIFDLQVTL